jgi:CRP-like cAMP-binding protein
MSSSEYALMLVRRGIIVRQRVDAHGCATAVDAIGPGGAAPVTDVAQSSGAAYAADDSMVCICPTGALRAAVDGGAPTASEVVALHGATLARVERLAEARGRGSALARVAAAVDVLADTLSPPRRLPVIPSGLLQRDVAALLALRQESVSRALGALERRGAITRTEDGIRIDDERLLKSAQ